MRDLVNRTTSRRTFVAATTKALGAISAGIFAGSRVGYAQTSALNDIRIAVVGCGGRGTNLAKMALNASRQNTLVAVGDVFQDRVDSAMKNLSRDKRIRDRIDVPRNRTFVGFDAYQRVLDTNVDYVFLAAPPAFRPLHYSAVVEAEKHAYLEKPMAVDSPGVRQILKANEIAKRKHLSIATGLTHRHSNRYSQIVARLQNNAPGAIQSLETDAQVDSWSSATRTAGMRELEYQIRNFRQFVWLSGGPLLEHVIHSIDNLNWLMKSHPVRATGRGDVNDQMGFERGDGFGSLSAQFTYPNGTVLKSNYLYTATRKPKLEVVHGDGWRADLSDGKIYDGANSVSWQYGGRKDDFNNTQLNRIFTGLRNGNHCNEVDYACDSTWTAIMGRMAAYLERDVTWQQTIESNQIFAPRELTGTAPQPPTLPDKFGDYAMAATMPATMPLGDG